MRLAALMMGIVANLPMFAAAQWSVELQPSGTQAVLPELGGRATLVVRCFWDRAEPVLLLHQPVSGPHQPVIYRFDDDDAKWVAAAVSQEGHLLHIWNDDEKQRFARAKRLRIQLRPFTVFDFDLSGSETIASTIRC